MQAIHKDNIKYILQIYRTLNSLYVVSATNYELNFVQNILTCNN